MKAKELFKKMFVCGYWDIVMCNSITDLSRCAVTIIHSSLDEWHADPFVLTINDNTYIFCERKKISKKNGDICLYKVAKKITKKLLIKEPFHLSFPNIFQFNNSYYIMPESSRGRSLRLYSFDSKSETAKLQKVLLTNCSYVDSVIKTEGNQTYVFSYDLCSNKLVISTLKESFSLVKENSVKDLNKTLRPAGNPIGNTFFFQDCSSVYGEAIKTMSCGEEFVFSESQNELIEQIKKYCLENNYSRYHTINFDMNSNKFVFDAYKEKINIFKPFLLLWRVICGNR